MKKVIVVALILAAAAVFVNDLGVYVSARRNLIEGTRNAADAAAGARAGRDAAARAAADAALDRGVEVYLFDQDDSRVEVWARIPLGKTLVYGRIRSLITGEASDTDPMLEHYETTPVR